LNSQVLGAFDSDTNLLSILRIRVFEDHDSTLTSEHHPVGNVCCKLLGFFLSALDDHFRITHVTGLPCHRHAVTSVAKSIITPHYVNLVATRGNLMEFFVILSNPVLTIQFDGKFLIGRVRTVVLADDATVETDIK